MAWFKIIPKFGIFLNKIEQSFFNLIFKDFPPPSLALNFNPSSNFNEAPSIKKFSLSDLIGDGFLYAVPKKRRSIEKRLNRKFGDTYYVYKLLRPKNHLRICDTCSHYYEVGVLCPHCYKNTMEETKLMQTAIQEKLGINPVEKDVVILYDQEKNSMAKDSILKKELIELPKPRPKWFSKNLMEKTTETGTESKEVKPSDLG